MNIIEKRRIDFCVGGWQKQWRLFEIVRVTEKVGRWRLQVYGGVRTFYFERFRENWLGQSHIQGRKGQFNPVLAWCDTLCMKRCRRTRCKESEHPSSGAPHKCRRMQTHMHVHVRNDHTIAQNTFSRLPEGTCQTWRRLWNHRICSPGSSPKTTCKRPQHRCRRRPFV
jgi:hypothetical protein